jgi:hypothetical protein
VSVLPLDDEVRRAHRALGPISARLLERAAADPRWCDHDAFVSLAAATRRTFLFQPWPFVLDRPAVEELAAACRGVVRLVRTLPERFFGNRPEHLAAFYRLGDPSLARMIAEEIGGFEGVIARTDFLWTCAGPRIIEVNLGLAGGWDLGRLASVCRSTPPVRDFFDELAASGVNLVHTPSMAILLEHVVGETLAATAPNGGDLDVALTTEAALTPDLAVGIEAYASDALAGVLARLAPGRRGRVVIGRAADLRSESRGVVLGRRPVAAVIEQGVSHRGPLFRSWKSGQVRLYNGPVALILADKRNLALLSEHAGRLFSAEEGALIDRVVPWTRQIRPGMVEHEGRRVVLRDLVLAERERLVMKPGRSGGGAGVALGHATPPPRWEAILSRALAAGDWIVQKRLLPSPLMALDGARGPAVHDVVWGVFTVGERYAGGMLRLAPRVEGAVVNSTRGAAEGLFFEEP